MMTEALANIHMTRHNKHQELSKKAPLKTQSQSTLNNRNNNNNSNFNNNNSNNLVNLQHLNTAAVGQFKRGSSFVVGQKLRESKWFTHGEIKIFCAVVESGFILEGENDLYGVAIWEIGFEKSKNPDHLTIHTALPEEKNGSKLKSRPCTLLEFWPEGSKVRINNKSDKTEAPLAEQLIRNQILVAQNSPKKKWHNSEHFAYYCRYGPVEHMRTRKITDRWITGTFFLKIRALTMAK